MGHDETPSEKAQTRAVRYRQMADQWRQQKRPRANPIPDRAELLCGGVWAGPNGPVKRNRREPEACYSVAI
jgi:hypothetical protein